MWLREMGKERGNEEQRLQDNAGLIFIDKTESNLIYYMILLFVI